MFGWVPGCEYALVQWYKGQVYLAVLSEGKKSQSVKAFLTRYFCRSTHPLVAFSLFPCLCALSRSWSTLRAINCRCRSRPTWITCSMWELCWRMLRRRMQRWNEWKSWRRACLMWVPCLDTHHISLPWDNENKNKQSSMHVNVFDSPICLKSLTLERLKTSLTSRRCSLCVQFFLLPTDITNHMETFIVS